MCWASVPAWLPCYFYLGVSETNILKELNLIIVVTHESSNQIWASEVRCQLNYRDYSCKSAEPCGKIARWKIAQNLTRGPRRRKCDARDRERLYARENAIQTPSLRRCVAVVSSSGRVRKKARPAASTRTPDRTNAHGVKKVLHFYLWLRAKMSVSAWTR